jgi:DNA invertase Pin-like site-specific DNA recombinase
MSSTPQERSIPQQREWALAAVAREGVSVVAEFQDAGKSGTEATRRGGFQNMLKFCQERWKARRPVDVLVIWGTDRFSRADSQETSWYIWEFRKAGVGRMLTASGWIDFSKPEHRVLFGIGQDLTNHHYSQDLARKSVRGKIQNAKEGRWNGGPVPYSYLVEYEWVQARGKKKQRPLRLVPDPETAPILRWMFAEYATGKVSTYQLARDLNERGVRPPGKAKHWDPTTIAGILKNELYTGDSVWNRRRTGKFFGTVDLEPAAVPRRQGAEEKVPAAHHVHKPRAHEGLVSRELWEAVQRQRQLRRKRTTPCRVHDFFLTGLLRCGHCGGSMTGRHRLPRRPADAMSEGRGAGGEVVKLFVCGNYSHLGLAGCNYNAIPEAPLFAAVARKLEAELTAPEVLARLEEAVRERASRADRRAEMDRAARDQARARAGQLQERISRATGKLIDEDDAVVQEACREEIRRLSEERDRLREAAESADLPAPAGAGAADAEALVKAAMAQALRFREALGAGEPAAVRAVLADLVDKVELWFDHRKAGRSVRGSFARGLVYLREDSPLTSCLPNTSARASRSRTRRGPGGRSSCRCTPGAGARGG